MGRGCPPTPVSPWEREPVKAVWRRGPTWKGHALLLRARRSEFRFPTEAPGHPVVWSLQVMEESPGDEPDERAVYFMITDINEINIMSQAYDKLISSRLWQNLNQLKTSLNNPFPKQTDMNIQGRYFSMIDRLPL